MNSLPPAVRILPMNREKEFPMCKDREEVQRKFPWRTPIQIGLWLFVLHRSRYRTWHGDLIPMWQSNYCQCYPWRLWTVPQTRWRRIQRPIIFRSRFYQSVRPDWSEFN